MFAIIYFLFILPTFSRICFEQENKWQNQDENVLPCIFLTLFTLLALIILISSSNKMQAQKVCLGGLCCLMNSTYTIHYLILFR